MNPHFSLRYTMALGACLGGNGTIVGASANLIVAGMAADRGVRISFMRYFRVGFPVMLLTILLSSIYVYCGYRLEKCKKIPPDCLCSRRDFFHERFFIQVNKLFYIVHDFIKGFHHPAGVGGGDKR